MFFSFNSGELSKSIIKGIDGPKTSASNNPTDLFGSLIFKATAKFTEVVDFPTPPFPEATIKICFTPSIDFFFGRPRASTSLRRFSRSS